MSSHLSEPEVPAAGWAGWPPTAQPTRLGRLWARVCGVVDGLRPARTRQLSDGTRLVLPSLWSLAPIGVQMILPLLALADEAASRDQPWGSMFAWFWCALLLVDALLLVAAVSRRRVLITPTGLAHRNLVRWRTIAWTDIQAVTVSGDGLSSTLQIWTADREAHSCAALTPADLRLVGDWWLAHRAPDWRPAWPTTVQAPSADPWRA